MNMVVKFSSPSGLVYLLLLSFLRYNWLFELLAQSSLSFLGIYVCVAIIVNGKVTSL